MGVVIVPLIAFLPIAADIIFFFTVQATTDIEAIATEIIKFSETHTAYNIFVGLIGGNTVISSRNSLSNAGIFVTSSTESMIHSYKKLLEWKYWKSEKIIWIPHISRQTEPIPILMNQNKTEILLWEYSIQTTNTMEYHSIEELLKYSNHIAGPYVIKMAWKHIAHKTELWWVIGPIYTQEDIISAYRKIEWNMKIYLPNEKMEWITIARYIDASPRVELFFGAKRDPVFGETFVIGAGGIFLTILDDTLIHIGKLDIPTILSILKSLRTYPALCGYRKQAEVDMNSLCIMIYQLSELFFAHAEIHEIDINPIFFENGKPCIADAKIYLET